MLLKWANLVAERAALVLVASLFVVLGAGLYGSGVFASLSDGGFDDPASEASREFVAEREIFGNKAVDVVAIYSSEDLLVSDPAFRAEVEDVLAALPVELTASVVDYWTAQDPSMVSEDGHAVQVLISMAGDGQAELSANYDELRPSLEAKGDLRTDVAGTWAVYGDVNTTVAEDLARAESISLPIVLLLSLIIFGSAVAALMPVLVGATAVVGALAVVRLITGVTEVSVFSINVITLLGMGLAIDYALFIISRFREELAKLPGDPDASAKAIAITLQTAGRTVLFSGLTVAAAMASLLVFPQNFLRSLGYGGMAAVVVAMVAALTLLPATLRLLGHRIDKGRLPRALTGRRRRKAVSDNGAWARLAQSVMRRPLTYLVVIVFGLLALASPFLGVSWGSVDYRVLPADSPAHVAAAKLNTEFGSEKSSASLLVSDASSAEVATVVSDLEAIEGILAVQPVAVEGEGEGEGEHTLLRVVWEGNSQSEFSQQMIADVRAIDLPDGPSMLVGGTSADTVDLLASVGAHLPWMGLIVVGVMLILLFLAFGSVVLPVKAILMNALSISASFGVVTWIFAQGHLEGLLGFTSTGYLDATQPILMLAILFGLSMDYEVFLLSRVREQWDRTHDNTLSVATGVQQTGRIITSAALLLAVVIGAFGTSGIVFMKMIGIGMLVALLIDATVVRAMLVPATMKLLGDWNWWAPEPMLRWWERHGLREGPHVLSEVTEPETVDA